MIRVLHLFDDDAGWEERVGATLLLDRLPDEQYHSSVAVTDGRTRRHLASTRDGIHLLPKRLGAHFLGAPALRTHLRAHHIDLIHAWGIDAALTAAAASAPTPIVVEQFDPGISDRRVRMLRSIQESHRIALACSTQTVRRRLIEKGCDPEACPVIRPGIDFGTINAARRRDLRGQLDLSGADRVFIAPEPASRYGGQFTAYWAIGVRSFVEPRVGLIIPGTSREQARIARLADRQNLSPYFRFPGRSFPFEDLISAADAMICASERDVSSTALAWSMAAGVPVIATAVYSTAELIADRHNGLLVKPDAPNKVALRIAALLDERDLLARMKEAARGQAYEVFSARRYVEQHARLYSNLLGNEELCAGIVDAAYAS